MASRDDVDVAEGTAIGAGGQTLQEQRKEAADYVAELAEELAQLARGSELPVLAYLLEVARLEARTRSQEIAEAGRRSERASSRDVTRTR